jgi:hypothetical protein
VSLLMIPMRAAASDPFAVVEYFAFRSTLLILFLIGLYRILRNEFHR